MSAATDALRESISNLTRAFTDKVDTLTEAHNALAVQVQRLEQTVAALSSKAPTTAAAPVAKQATGTTKS